MGKSAAKWYAVRKPAPSRVFQTWNECKNVVHGTSGAVYKSFPTKEDALSWANHDGSSAATAVKPKHYYAVAVGEHPGIYTDWAEAQPLICGFLGAKYKKFSFLDDAQDFMRQFGHEDAVITIHKPITAKDLPPANNGVRPESNKAILSLPLRSKPLAVKPEDNGEDTWKTIPLASQSYFLRDPAFEPDETTTFTEEFHRFASSQGIEPNTDAYREEHARAVDHELKFLYLQPSKDKPDDGEDASVQSDADNQWQPEEIGQETDRTKKKQKLMIYQGMCRDVGLLPADTMDDCLEDLKTKVLVNIVDYIDSRRTGQPVKVWTPDQFAAFKAYSFRTKKIIHLETAKAGDGCLAALLRKFRNGSRSEESRGRKRKRSEL